MRQKFGRSLRDKDAFGFDFSVDFEVESYLRYRGSQFVTRFDPNSYLYITKAMDYFDLSAGHATLGAAFERARARFLVISFTSDWLYPTYQSLETVSALRSRSLDVAYCELKSTYGHDAFLLETVEQSEVISGFLQSVFWEESGKARPAKAGRSENALSDADAERYPQISTRSDFALIAEMITPESTVLDLGAGMANCWLGCARTRA